MLKKLFFSVTAITLTVACNNNAGNEADASQDTSAIQTEDQGVTTEPENDAPESYEKGGLKIYPLAQSVQFDNAKLTLNAPKDEMVTKDNKVKFDFSVDGYELGVPTSDAGERGLAASDKGQHIHLIVDNGPYSAHYDPKFEKEFEPGHHIAIAFLSRSYHESVKNTDAAVVFQFTTGSTGEKYENMDLSRPMLFYSRPKGEYKGDDAKKVLFDFYVKNAELKPDGYSVIATVNDSLRFEFDKWQPYVIEGLPMGENTINIKLVDASGNAVDSKMNNVTRKFTLSK